VPDLCLALCLSADPESASALSRSLALNPEDPTASGRPALVRFLGPAVGPLPAGSESSHPSLARSALQAAAPDLWMASPADSDWAAGPVAESLQDWARSASGLSDCPRSPWK
jgi:hypothetical protein